MDDATRERLVDLLRARQRAYLRGALETEADLASITEDREPELEERAQQDRMTRLLERLDARDRRGHEAVSAALDRAAAGTYGACLVCGGAIPVERLAALPEAERCVACAVEAEHTPRGRVGGRSLVSPSERVDSLTDDEIVTEVQEVLRQDARLRGGDLLELEILCRRKTLYLSGALPSETTHEIVRGTVEDVIGVANVIDRVRIQPISWQRRERTPRRTTALPAGPSPEDDATEAAGPYDPPTAPVPDEECE